MEENIKVALLGVDAELLKSVSNRVNETRPAQVRYFTDLKDFLDSCIEENPDLIGFCVTFPHPSAPKFPKVFKMSLNVPVLTFGEKDDLKTRKLCLSIQSDIQIQGKITAQNLWIKISNLIQQQTTEIEKRKSTAKSSATTNVTSKQVVSSQYDIGGYKNGSPTNRLSSLFAALDDSSSANRDSNIIKSTDATGFKKQQVHSFDNTDPEYASDSNGDFERVQGLSGSTNNEPMAVSVSSSPKMNSSGRPNLSLVKNELDRLDESNEPNERDLQNDIDRAMEDMFGSLIKNEDSGDSATPSKNDFGKVRLSDESEVKKQEKKKSKNLIEKEILRKRNILIESCDSSARDVYEATRNDDVVPTYLAKKICIYILESDNYKGYLILSLMNESINNEADSFQKTLFVKLKQSGLHFELSNEMPIELLVQDYPRVVAEFSDFSLNFKNSGGQINIAFVKREVVRPLFQPSEKEGMYNVDIKVIPPKTLVNFDAYIFLPRNNRFVRYLKAGRSLSLKQAKRFMEEMEKGKLYLPIDQKNQFIAFFIQNTLNWEFTLHKKKDIA